LNCPMGKEGIRGKQPMEVAIAIAAKVMDLYQNSKLTSDKTATIGGSANLTKESLEYV